MADEAVMVGDVVRLKSGGPSMTVESEVSAVRGTGGTFERRGGYRCVWFTNGSVSAEVFASNALEKVPPAAPTTPTPSAVPSSGGYVS